MNDLTSKPIAIPNGTSVKIVSVDPEKFPSDIVLITVGRRLTTTKITINRLRNFLLDSAIRKNYII